MKVAIRLANAATPVEFPNEVMLNFQERFDTCRSMFGLVIIFK